MFNVVFRNISGSLSHGAITWTSFKDEEAFNTWYGEKMQSWYQVVEKDVTQEQAIELCSTPEANLAALLYRIRQATRFLALGEVK